MDDTTITKLLTACRHALAFIESLGEDLFFDDDDTNLVQRLRAAIAQAEEEKGGEDAYIHCQNQRLLS